jgi:hypothetical protein
MTNSKIKYLINLITNSSLAEKRENKLTAKKHETYLFLFRVLSRLILFKFFWRNAGEFFKGAVKGRFGIEAAIEGDGEQV